MSAQCTATLRASVKFQRSWNPEDDLKPFSKAANLRFIYRFKILRYVAFV